jgi:hypothetical protein
LISQSINQSITFAEDKVKHYMGVSEMLIASSLCGMLFSLFSAQPLTIIGATGPLLVFEYSLYKVRPSFFVLGCHAPVFSYPQSFAVLQVQ